MAGTLNISHEWGFFSCCSVRLWSILEYVKRNGSTPDLINDEGLFSRYKTFRHSVSDLFFDHEPLPLTAADAFAFTVAKDSQDYARDIQFSPYRDLDFARAVPWVRSYFAPSNSVRLNVDALRSKYRHFRDGPVCSVLYRGNDKRAESVLAPYGLFIDKAREVLARSPDVAFHVQTDELDFAEAFAASFPGRSFVCDETPMIRRGMHSVTDLLPPPARLEFALNFLSLVYLLSGSQHLITHSGNCGLWAVLFRGNISGVHQWLNNAWLCPSEP